MIPAILWRQKSPSTLKLHFKKNNNLSLNSITRYKPQLEFYHHVLYCRINFIVVTTNHWSPVYAIKITGSPNFFHKLYFLWSFQILGVGGSSKVIWEIFHSWIKSFLLLWDSQKMSFRNKTFLFLLKEAQ